MRFVDNLEASPSGHHAVHQAAGAEAGSLLPMSTKLDVGAAALEEHKGEGTTSHQHVPLDSVPL